jgi:prepilin-type processing-associated H-X9-DG protein
MTMYCPKCGTLNPDNVQLCQSCSWVLSSTTTTTSPVAKTSGLAITAFVLGILSLLIFTIFITFLPAIIFGIVALVKIAKSGGKLKGKALAITGIAIPVAILPLIILMMILMPALVGVKEQARKTMCSMNMKGLELSIGLYTNENHGKYPTSSQWCDLLLKSGNIPEKQFRCPSAHDGRCSYAMNKNVEKLGEDAPPDMVLLFETTPGWNQSGGPELLTTKNHQDKGCNVLFNDGRVEFVKTEDINKLRW